MKRSIFIFVGVITFLVGMSVVQMIPRFFGGTGCPAVKVALLEHTHRQFTSLGYNRFKVSEIDPRFSEEIYVDHESNLQLNPEYFFHILEEQCGSSNKNLIEHNYGLDEVNESSFDECISVGPDNKATIFLRVKGDVWVFTASSLDLAKEFERSNAFSSYRAGI